MIIVERHSGEEDIADMLTVIDLKFDNITVANSLSFTSLSSLFFVIIIIANKYVYSAVELK